MFVMLTIALVGSIPAFSQPPAVSSQEISEVDGKPVLLKHLPNYESVETTAIFGTDKTGLESAAGQGVLTILDFPKGTEYVTAVYPEGRLVIVEYANPQASSEADTKIQQYILANPDAGLAYRRIGNYNAFVFGASDVIAATTLLEQVRYEKTVQWLGEDPYLLRKLEKYMITTSRDIMISTVFVILIGLASSIIAGIAAGFIFFRFRDHKRATRTAYSDAGGLTRLNLDGLSE